jgi:hypothetical protein
MVEPIQHEIVDVPEPQSNRRFADPQQMSRVVEFSGRILPNADRGLQVRAGPSAADGHNFGIMK